MKKSHVMPMLFVTILVIVAAVGLMAFAPFQTVAPQDGGPATVTSAPAAPATDPGANDAVFVAELIAITAFFQKRFGLGGYGLIGAAGAVGLALWFSPLLSATFPAAGPWIDSGVTFVKLFLSSMGSVDFVTTVGKKIVSATPPSVTLSTPSLGSFAPPVSPAASQTKPAGQ